MRRIVIASLVMLVVAGPYSLRAQQMAIADSAGAAAAPRPDTVQRLVRVSSRHLPFEMRDLAMMNCTYLSDSDDVMTWIVPYACVRRMTGTLTSVDANSVAFVRNGHPIRLPMRQVKKVEQFAGTSRWRATVGGVVGGFTGLVLATFAGIGGAYGNENEGSAFATTALVLTTAGAVIGAHRSGTIWSELPYAPIPSYAPIGPAEPSREQR